MKQADEVALRFLKQSEAKLVLQLAKIRRAIAALEPSTSAPVRVGPRSKLEFLREVLRHHRGGVPVSAIPGLLEAKGYKSCSPNSSTNWLSPSQLRHQDRFFIRQAGLIKPTPEFLAEVDAAATGEQTVGVCGVNGVQP